MSFDIFTKKLVADRFDERHERGNKEWQMTSPFMMVVLFLPFGRISRPLMRKKSYW